MLQNISENIKRYQSVIAWILQDSILRFKKKVFLIVISGFLGAALQVQTIALLFYYAKALEAGKTINILGYSLHFRTSQSMLIVLGIIIFLSLILAAWFNYYSRNRVLKLWRRYEEFCAKRIFMILAQKRLQLSIFYYDIIDDDTRLLKIVRTDSRYCGRVLEIVLSVFTPTITAVISIGALIYINTLLTMLLILPLMTTIFFWYRASREASNNASLLEQYSSDASTEYRSLIRWFKQDVYSLPNEYIENLYQYLESSKQFLNAFEGRLNSLAKSDLASNIFLAITIFIILMVLGWNIISQQTGWGELIIYVFALRYSLFNIRQVTQKITAINLFYPHIKRYLEFLTIARDSQLREKDKSSDSAPVKLKNSYYFPQDLSWDGQIEIGSKIALVTSSNINQYRLFHILKTFLDHPESLIQDWTLSAYFASIKNEYVPGIPLNVLLSIPHISTRYKLYENLKGSGIEHKLIKELPPNLDNPITEEAWKQISPQVKLSIKLLNYQFYLWLFIEESNFNKLPKVTQFWFLQNKKGFLCIIISPERVSNIGKYQEEYIIYLKEGKVILADTITQFLSYKDQFKARISQSHNTTKKNTTVTEAKDYESNDDLLL